MSYFSKFLRSSAQPPPKPPVDHVQEFQKSWHIVQNTLLEPDERQLSKGIGATDVPVHLQAMVDSLVSESSRIDSGETGECMEYLLKNDVLGTLVRLSETDRPSGIQAEVLRAVQNMVVLLDDQFLVHSAVHKAVLRLLRTCVGDDIQEQLDGRNKPMGAAGSATRSPPSEHEEDLVNLLCILCSRILTYRELLMIFFHDKHWYRSEPLFSVEEEDEDEDDDEFLSGDPGDTEEQEEDGREASPTPSQATITSAKQPPKPSTKTEYEFLLFNYLLRFVHREGQIGEFARAGLLFLIDVAMYPGDVGNVPSTSDPNSESSRIDPVQDAALALAEYILDGDFSEVLGAGLNAVFSLLPRKLGFFPFIHQDESASSGMVIGSSGLDNEDEREKILANRDRSRAMGIEDAQNPDVKARLDHFLRVLEFLQDVLRKNVEHEGMDASTLIGAQIVQSVLGAVRRTFLENVLYPSLLECSDADGSAVAIMSYIEVIVRTLRPGPLLDLIVEFLVSEDSDGPSDAFTDLPTKTIQPPRTQADSRAAKLRRRKSSAMVLLEMEAPDSRKKSEYFTSTGRFTLRDLLLANIKSKNQATATTALQLLSTILTHQTRITAERLLVVIPDLQATSFPHPGLIHGLGHLEKTMADLSDDDNPTEMRQPDYLGPTARTSFHPARDDVLHPRKGDGTGYEHYLHDALLAIQSQPLYRYVDTYGFDEQSHSLKHRLNANDPILSQLLEHTRTFFSNTPEFNVALTGVFATLAINPYRSLAGWLTFAHKDSDFIEPFDSPLGGFDERDDRSIDSRIDARLTSETNVLPAARMDEHSRPVVYTVLHSLLNQLERYRQQVDEFDMYLKERRQGLLFSERLTDALEIMLDQGLTMGSTSPEPVAPPKPKSRPSATAAIASFLTPKKAKPKSTTSQPATPQREPRKELVPPSPFGAHYHQTNSITLEPSIAPVPFTALWTPSKQVDWNIVEEDVFGPTSWSEQSTKMEGDANDCEDEPNKPTTVTLSQLLDNVVILEESIKELVAIIHARRSLGIDALRYV